MIVAPNEDRDPAAARQRLLDAAGELFSAHGIHATSVDDVIAEANVAGTTFDRHFSGKDDLVTAYLEGRYAAWRATLDAAIARAGDDARSQLLAFFDALGAWHHDPRFQGCSFANAAAELAACDPARVVVDVHQRSLRERMADIAAQIPHSAPNLLVDQLMMLFEGAATTHAFGTVTHAVDKARMTAAPLIYAG